MVSMRLIKRVILPLIALAASSALTWAGCKSDCRDDYDSEIESCKSQYDDPDEVDELRQCIQTATDEYEACIDECNN